MTKRSTNKTPSGGSKVGAGTKLAKEPQPQRAPPENAVPHQVRVGQTAPDFELADDSGRIRRLVDFRGKPVVLYFYPADDTPGCTKEACNFRDDYAAYVKAGVTIMGVSPDSVKSHARFRAKYALPFSLLADEGHAVCSRYGAWGQKSFMGRSFDGVLRTTFLIDGNGRIARIFEQVRPAEHSGEILSAVKELS